MNNRPWFIDAFIASGIAALVIAIIVRTSATPSEVTSAATSGDELKPVRLGKCITNLKGLHQALMLYREENGGADKFGSIYEMGLPSSLQINSLEAAFPKANWHCPEVPNQFMPNPKGFSYIYAPEDPRIERRRPSWAQYSKDNEGRSILFIDINHDLGNRSWGDPHVEHRAFGITLDGQLVQNQGVGAISSFDWWRTMKETTEDEHE